jgi:dihydroxyacid dehydratase/phosphogluconate dehydratase
MKAALPLPTKMRSPSIRVGAIQELPSWVVFQTSFPLARSRPPEAQVGGPIALIRNGDPVTIDTVTHRIDVHLSDDEMENRRKNWTPPPFKATRGTLYKYIKTVKSASEGCVTDE